MSEPGFVAEHTLERLFAAQEGGGLLTHCFLSHNWGNSPDFDNHKRVKAINKELRERHGLLTWFDDEGGIKGVNVLDEMARGIENTHVAIIFITNEYRNKVNGPNLRDNCKYEFGHALQQLTQSNMITVVMEKSMTRTQSWKGALGAALCNLLYIDFSVAVPGSSTFAAKIDELAAKVWGIVGSSYGLQLWKAAKSGSVDDVRGFIAEISPVILHTHVVNFSNIEECESTAFFEACAAGHIECVKLLSSIPGIDINRPDRNRRSPFAVATLGKHTEVVDFLNSQSEVDKELVSTGGRLASAQMPRVQFLVPQTPPSPRSLEVESREPSFSQGSPRPSKIALIAVLEAWLSSEAGIDARASEYATKFYDLGVETPYKIARKLANKPDWLKEAGFEDEDDRNDIFHSLASLIQEVVAAAAAAMAVVKISSNSTSEPPPSNTKASCETSAKRRSKADEARKEKEALEQEEKKLAEVKAEEEARDKKNVEEMRRLSLGRRELTLKREQVARERIALEEAQRLREEKEKARKSIDRRTFAKHLEEMEAERAKLQLAEEAVQENEIEAELGRRVYEAVDDDGDEEGLRALVARCHSAPAALKWKATDELGLGYTAAINACVCGYTPCLEILVKACPDVVNATDNYNCTPLWHAAAAGEFSCLELLLSLPNIDVNLGDVGGRSPLFAACEYGKEDCVRKLVASRTCDVNSTDSEGRTPLFVACEMLAVDVVRLLLSLPTGRVDRTRTSNDGRTPLEVAVDSPDIQVLLGDGGLGRLQNPEEQEADDDDDESWCEKSRSGALSPVSGTQVFVKKAKQFDLKRVFGGGGGGGIPEAPAAAASSAEKVSALPTPIPPTTSSGHSPQPIFSLALLHDGRVVSGSGDQTLRIWRPHGDTFVLVGSLKGHSKDVNAIAVFPDGVRIVSGSDDWMLKIWNLAKDPPACEATLRRHDGQVRAIAILGTLGFVSGSNDNNLAVWTKSTASGGFACNSAILEGHTDAVRAVAALADGRIVSGSADKTLRVWTKVDANKYTATDPLVLVGHTEIVKAVVALADSRVVSASDDTTLRVWRIGQRDYCCEAILRGHSGSVNALAVLPAGAGFCSGSQDMTLRVWSRGGEGGGGVAGGAGGGEGGFFGSPGGGEPGDTKHKSGVLAVVALSDGRLVSGDVGGFLCLSECPARF